MRIYARVLEGDVNIITNGGDGNKGQDGADGRKGPDSLDKVPVYCNRPYQESITGSMQLPLIPVKIKNLKPPT